MSRSVMNHRRFLDYRVRRNVLGYSWGTSLRELDDSKSPANVHLSILLVFKPSWRVSPASIKSVICEAMPTSHRQFLRDESAHRQPSLVARPWWRALVRRIQP